VEDQEYEQTEKIIEARKARRAELRRKRIRNQRIALGVALLVLVLLIVLIVRGCSGKEPTNDSTNDNTQTDQQTQVSLPTTPDTTTVTLSAVGDIMVYDEQLTDALQADGSYDFSHCFTDVASLLSGSDLTVGNFEANFCGAPYSGYPNFNAPESLATTLADLGFDILQTANTYSIQNGLTGLTSTIRYITEAGMSPLGTYYTEAEKQTNNGVVIKEVNGVKIAFLAYTKGVNNMYLPTGSEYCVDVLYDDYYSNYSQVNEDAILASIQSAKDLEADVIVAMLHWGGEYELSPTDSQKEIANLMFTNGVDVILGSHSHLVGPMEEQTITTVDGEEKQVFLAYSLGNFVSSMTDSGTQSSVILNLEFTKDNDSGETTISNVDYVPLYISVNPEATAGSQIQVLDVQAEIEKYDSGAADKVSDEIYTALKNVQTQLATNTASSFERS
jgi:poly-gamma-glutamate capsule biosynthesis protein CapA/YwtB (metallophosphatase superfamily)